VYSSMVAYTKTVHTFGPVVQFCPKMDMCSYDYTACIVGVLVCTGGCTLCAELQQKGTQHIF